MTMMKSVVSPLLWLGAALVALLVVLTGQTALAVDVTTAMNVLAYAMDSACPTGWSDLSFDSKYKGRLIKGSTVNIGGTFGTAVTNNDIPTHNHASWSRRLVISGSKRTSWLIDSGPRMLDDVGSFTLTQAHGSVDSRAAGIQRVSLRLCRYTAGNSFNLPPGFVVFLYHTVTTCPAGFENFAPADGRFLVFAAPGKVMSSDVQSAAAPVGDVQNVGKHNHYMPAQNMNMKKRDAAIGTGGLGPYAADWVSQRLLEAGTTSDDYLNIPYVQLRACKVTATSTAPRLPNSRLIFFYDGQTCPTLFREATARTDEGGGLTPFSNLVGRMIFNLYESNNYPGQTNTAGDQLYCATGSCGNGQIQHSHWVSTSFDLPAHGSGGAWDTCCTSWTDYRSYSWSWQTNNNNVASLFPYRVMRACSPQLDTSNPTHLPTKSPTTSRPSLTPTTSYPTRNPTQSPTSSKPTHSPTNQPTGSPTSSMPTMSPTTSRPSATPTTSGPTTSPTPMPSASPTPSPVWKDVCTQEDDQVFVSYDNYVVQAGKCWSDCRLQILGSDRESAGQCIDNCLTLSLYTPICRGCMIFWMLTQDEKCRGPCLSSKFSTTCAECTNQYARQDFKTCTGFEGADISQGGGDGGQNAPREPGIDAGVVSGAALGGVLALAGLVVAGRKIREKMLEDDALAKEMEANIFRNAPNEAPPPAPPTRTKMMLSKLPWAKKSAVSNASEFVVAAEGARVSGSNPLYVDSQQDPEAAAASATTTTAVAPVAPTEPSVSGQILRTRYSFHGMAPDELNVPAGVTLIAIERNDDWFVCQDEKTGKYGLIPASYVS